MFTLKSISRIGSVFLIVISLLVLTFNDAAAAPNGTSPAMQAKSANTTRALTLPRSVSQENTLSIDPTLVWNTFQGGTWEDYTNSIITDESGNIYVIGGSYAGWGTPVRAYTSGDDAFVAKLDSSGALVWNTFLGGDGTDSGKDIVLDTKGNIYVVGLSGATWGSPRLAQHPGGYDVFVAKLNSSGVLVWNTFLGDDKSDEGYGIAVDNNGNVYVTGRSIVSWGNPRRAFTNGLDDAFAAKLDTSGKLIWNTFLGSDSSDLGRGIVVDGNGNVYVTGESAGGWSCSPAECTAREYSGLDYEWDAFVAKLDTSGNLIWNTFLGGDGGEYGDKLRINQDGNIYVTGLSDATWGNPIRPYTSGWDAFAAKLSPSGNLIWNTFLGGNGSSESGNDIAVTGNDNVYIIGYSNSDWGNPARAYSGGDDAFVAKLNGSGSLLWNTFLGGSEDDYGAAITVGENGDVYVAGHSYSAWGSPVRAHTNVWDGFVAKIDNKEVGTLVLDSIAAQDGWILESSENSNKGGKINRGDVTFRLGDNAAKKQYRSILSFNTGSLPDTAVITKVMLNLKKNQVVGGGNPIATFQGVMLDIKKGFFGTAASLQTSDFQAAASKSYGPSKPTLVKNWYSIDLTAGKSVINKLSTGSGLTQIRLRFKLDDNNDMVANYLRLYSGDALAASRPQLVITYYVP